MSKNLYDEYNNEQDSIPRSVAGTGTLTSVNNKEKIVGTGTLFLAQLSIGDFIYIKGQNDFRKVINIVSNTELTIETPFGVDLAGDAFDRVIRPWVRKVSWVVGTGAVLIDGISFPTGASDTIEADAAKGKKASGDYVDPIDVDATGGKIVKTSISF
jgi:hypothetical protein